MNGKNNEKTVYVLGSGFSRDYNPSHFPLMSDFLNLAKINRYYQPEDTHSALKGFIKRYFGENNENIESILTFLNARSLDDPFIKYENRSVLYDQLLEIILDTFDVAHFHPINDETKNIYSAFGDKLAANESVVISFNYDLLLEYLLFDKGHWRGFDGYGAKIPPIDEATSLPIAKGEPSYLNPETDQKSKVLILKPHGSVNWGVPTRDCDFVKEIYQSDQTYYYSQTSLEQVPYSLRPRGIKDLAEKSLNFPITTYYRPVIIPPILDKSNWFEKTSIRLIWHMAKESIREADCLIVIGYSMPVTDYSTEFLMRQANAWSSMDTFMGLMLGKLSSERKPKRVIVVDPCAEGLRHRYQSIFGPDVECISETFVDWQKK
jgi:hypothetical protein